MKKTNFKDKILAYHCPFELSLSIGTITSYRILLGEEALTRADFLGEAGTHKVII